MTRFLFQYLISFLVFSILQALFINGIKECFGEGMILYKFRLFIDKKLSEFWRKPIYSCIKCMGGLYSIITFMPTVIYVFGFKWIEIPICIFNIGVLIYLNYFFYKRQ